MSDRGKTVLVVDDEESMRFFLTKTLRREGYHVVAACDGPDGIAAAQADPPDVALLDVRMPGMDGVALMRALRATYPHLPIVLMTAFGSVHSALHAMKQGANDYVTKPFRVDAIRTTVARALESAATGARPPTVRAMVTESVDPSAQRPDAPRDPRPSNVEVPHRGIAAFLVERAEERGLPVAAIDEKGHGDLKQITRLCELVFVDEILELTGGNVSRAAEMAGITRPNMHRKVTDLGLSADAYRRRAGSRRKPEEGMR